MTSAKLQRWTDLLAALLRRQSPASFDELSRDVPAYALDGRKAKPSVLRTFERDKDELRAFGVRIATVADDEGKTIGYRLSPRDFYLPYLALTQLGRRATPRRVDKHGYHSLPTLDFDADELAAIVQAGRRVGALDNPLVGADARSALRKLAVDLPVDAVDIPDQVRALPARKRPRPAIFTALNAALLARKRVRFEYHSLTNDSTNTHDVEPYGLFFLSSHWYLVGRDRGTDQLRNFRLSRVAKVLVNKKEPQTTDFEVPEGFRLREHAHSRQAWELGSADVVAAVVEFHARTGAALPALNLGESVPGHADRRRFSVRRADVFVRWLLSFGGAAIPVEPPDLVSRFARAVRKTAALYGTPHE